MIKMRRATRPAFFLGKNRQRRLTGRIHSAILKIDISNIDIMEKQVLVEEGADYENR